MLRKLLTGLLHKGRRAEVSTDAAADDGRRVEADTGSCTQLLSSAEAAAKAGRLATAIEYYRACAEAYPDTLDAHLGMASVLVDLWCLDEVVSAYRRALELSPASGAIWSALLFHSHYLCAVEPRAMFELHRRYGELMRRPGLPHAGIARKADDGTRRLRIGYVSPNFSRHSVGYFIEPVIRCHDRARFEIFCYYSHRLSDETTQRIRTFADGWRDIAGLADASIIKMIGDDRIDILVDLAGHSKGNHLGVFAAKPAPVQITWLGYPDTTGLDAMDYRVTDKVADPVATADALSTERLLRIDDCFLCYQPPADSPLVGKRAPESAVVFCSFNSLPKVTEPMLKIWSRILSAVPRSRLALKAAALSFPDTVDRVTDALDRSGIDPSRVELRGWVTRREDHLERYQSIDVALDTFPYNGTTTTCEALWMGVPVATLAGDVHMSRVGASILTCVGLRELVASDAQSYTDIAIALAGDPMRREELRASLRERLTASPLLDHSAFTRKLENHFATSWAGRATAEQV